MKTSRESDYSNQTCDAVVVASDHDHLQREEGIKKPERKGRQQQQSPLRSGNIHKYLHPVKVSLTGMREIVFPDLFNIETSTYHFQSDTIFCHVSSLPLLFC